MIEIPKLTDEEAHQFVLGKIKDFATEALRTSDGSAAIERLRAFIADVRRFLPDL